MCALHKITFPSLFAFLLLTAIPPLFAELPPGDPNQETLNKIRSVEERLKKIEANQQEILNREDKILAEIDRLRIWTHRQ